MAALTSALLVMRLHQKRARALATDSSLLLAELTHRYVPAPLKTRFIWLTTQTREYIRALTFVFYNLLPCSQVVFSSDLRVCYVHVNQCVITRPSGYLNKMAYACVRVILCTFKESCL